MNPTPDKLTVDWFQSADQIPQSLWQSSFPAGAEGRWWYRVLDRSGLSDQFSFFYGRISRNGEGIGIAPVFVMNVPIDLVTPPAVTKVLHFLSKIRPSLRHQRTLFIGSPCADECTIGLCPGIKLADVSDTLQDAVEALSIRQHARLIVWKDLPDAYLTELKPMIHSRHMFTIPGYPGTVVHLPKGNVDAYLATLTAARRYSLRGKLKKSRAMGDLHATTLQHPNEEQLAEIFALFMQTYSKGKTKFERLGLPFFQHIAQCDEAYFLTLRLPQTNRMVAFMLLFRLGPKVINKFIGLDYTLGDQWFMYFRLWEAAVTWAMSIGADELQSGQTVYRPKLDIGHQLIPLTNVCLNRNWLLHQIFSRVARTITWSTIDPDLKAHVDAQSRKENKVTEKSSQ